MICVLGLRGISLPFQHSECWEEQNGWKASLTPLNTSTIRETEGLGIKQSLPSTTSLSCGRRRRNQTCCLHPILKSCPVSEAERVCWRGCSLSRASHLPCSGTCSCEHGVHAVIAATSGVTPTPDFLKLAGKITRGLAERLKGVALGRKRRGNPSLLLISTTRWFAAQRTWGIIVTRTDGEILTHRKALTHEARLRRRSRPGLTRPPAPRAGWALQRLERTKQQQNYFHSGAGDSGRGRRPGPVDERSWALLMTPCSLTGWSRPSPLRGATGALWVSLQGRGACPGGPSRRRGGGEGGGAGAEGSLSPLWPTTPWPQEAPPHPRPTRTELGRRVHGGAREETAGVSSDSTHSFTGLCNAPFNHQMRISMQMCPLCNGVSKILCCLKPLFQAVRLPSLHDELECQILITKQIISTLSSRCVAADSCLTSRFLLLRNPSCNPGLRLYQFYEWLRNDKNPEKLPGVWAHLDPLPWFAGMRVKKWSSKDRMAGVILAKLA